MIENTAYVVIWMTLPFLWHYLLKTAGLSLRQLTIPAFVILAFYGFQYIGLPVLYFRLDEFRAVFVYDKWLVMRVFAYTAITITLMIAGCVAARRIFGPIDWPGGGIRENGRLQTFCLLVLFGICCSVLYLYIAKIGIGNIALLAVLGVGGDVQVDLARSAMGNAFEGKYHWYHMFMNKLLLFCAYAMFAQYLLRPNRASRLMFGVVFLVAAFAMTMAVEKGPMADLLIALFLVYVLVKKEGLFPIRGSLYIAAVLLAVLIVFYMSFSGVESPVKAVFSVASRAFTGQIQAAYHYLQYFPHHHEFLFGRSFPNPGDILPFRHYSLTLEMMAWHDPGLSGIGVVGSMPTVFWGEMYANFGFPGVLLPPFFVGFFLYWLNSLALRLIPDPSVIALFVWMMIHFKNLAASSLSGFLLDEYALAALLCFFAIAFISGGGVVRLRNRLPRKVATG